MKKKSKFITALLAAVMILAVFLSPMTAYANEDTGEPISEYGEDDSKTVYDTGELNLNELLESFSPAELMAIFSMMEMSGFNDEPDESAIPDNSKPFTPDGQATVVDLSYEGDGKMFYTFKTPAGNVFYLIIDRQRGTDNVYFLNAVTEYDLLALAESGKVTPNVPESAIPTTEKPTEKPSGTDEPNDPDAEKDPPAPKKNNNGMMIFLLIGIAAVGIGGYYIKVIRPKQQADMDDEDDDIPDDDDGGEIQFENEPEEADEYEDNEETDVSDEE